MESRLVLRYSGKVSELLEWLGRMTSMYFNDLKLHKMIALGTGKANQRTARYR